MKARLEPRIVAAKIHVLAPAVHGVPEPPEEIKASSQGGLMDAMDAVSYEFGSEDPETAPPWSLEIADFNLSRELAAHLRFCMSPFSPQMHRILSAGKPRGRPERKFYVAKCCRRLVGDAGKRRRQTLLWHCRRCSQSSHRRAAPQRQGRVHPCSSRRIRSFRRGRGGLLKRKSSSSVRDRGPGGGSPIQWADRCAQRRSPDYSHCGRCRDQCPGHECARRTQSLPVLRNRFSVHRANR